MHSAWKNKATVFGLSSNFLYHIQSTKVVFSLLAVNSFVLQSFSDVAVPPFSDAISPRSESLAILYVLLREQLSSGRGSVPPCLQRVFKPSRLAVLPVNDLIGQLPGFVSGLVYPLGPDLPNSKITQRRGPWILHRPVRNPVSLWAGTG